MPTGDSALRAPLATLAPRPPHGPRAPTACGPRHRQAGFSYLLLLFSLVLAGLAAAHTGQHWVQAGQRAREAELAWRAQQITQALALYAQHTPVGHAAWPLALDELLADHRHQPPARWLRQAFADPFTAQADWLLQRDADGRIRGLASRSRQPAFGPLPAGAELQTAGAGPVTVGDWWFHAVLRRPDASAVPAAELDAHTTADPGHHQANEAASSAATSGGNP
jgi:type II secretory pathway pseudopilin PulG